MNLSTECIDCLTSSRLRPNTASVHTGSNVSTALVQDLFYRFPWLEHDELATDHNAHKMNTVRK